jgi:putative pimeloyl-BioC--CoA transferase BioH
MNGQTGTKGANLVLLHGWGMNSRVFADVAWRLERSFCIHLLDLPGFGRQVAAGEMVHDAEGWLNHLEAQLPAECHLLGWSLGGQLATLLALRNPQRIRSLITVASSPCFVAEEEWPGMQPGVLANFAQLLVKDPAKTIDRFLAIQAMGSPSAREDIRHLRNEVLSAPLPHPAALTLGLSLLETLDLRTELVQLTMPVLHLFGRLDGLVPVAVAEKIRTLQPEAKVEIFASSSHAPFITEPERFVAEVSRFVAQ